MRRITTSTFIALLAIIPTVVAAAQDTSTPVASNGIGDQVVYIDDSGNPIANATVDGGVRGWQDYGDRDDPDAGFEYVVFTITVESVITRTAVEVDESDFLLQDASGFLWDPSNADAAEDVDIIPLENDVDLPNGESVTFLVVFEVFQGEPLEHLFWQPDSGRLLTLASLDDV